MLRNDVRLVCCFCRGTQSSVPTESIVHDFGACGLCVVPQTLQRRQRHDRDLHLCGRSFGILACRQALPTVQFPKNREHDEDHEALRDLKTTVEGQKEEIARLLEEDKKARMTELGEHLRLPKLELGRYQRKQRQLNRPPQLK